MCNGSQVVWFVWLYEMVLFSSIMFVMFQHPWLFSRFGSVTFTLMWPQSCTQEWFVRL